MHGKSKEERDAAMKVITNELIEMEVERMKTEGMFLLMSKQERIHQFITIFFFEFLIMTTYSSTERTKKDFQS